MKKVLLFVCTLLILLSLTACKNPAQVAAKKHAQDLLKDAGLDDVNLDDGSLSFKAEDGTEVTFGKDGTSWTNEEDQTGSISTSGEWPKSGAGALIPPFTSGTQSAFMESEEMFYATFENVSANDYTGYVQAVKDAGFTDSVVEGSSDGTDYISAF